MKKITVFCGEESRRVLVKEIGFNENTWEDADQNKRDEAVLEYLNDEGIIPAWGWRP